MGQIKPALLNLEWTQNFANYISRKSQSQSTLTTLSISFKMYQFYFVLFLSSVVASLDFGENITTPCGLYGFRCIDTKRAQFCDEKLEAEEASPKPRIFQCAEGLVCDEEKQEFCSPGEPKQKCATTDRIIDKRSFHNVRRLNDRVDEVFDFEQDSDTTSVPNTTADDDDDDDSGPTEEPENDRWNGSPPILCTSHGFHAGMLITRFNGFLYFSQQTLQMVPTRLCSSSAISRKTAEVSFSDTCDAALIECLMEASKHAFSTERLVA